MDDPSNSDGGYASNALGRLPEKKELFVTKGAWLPGPAAATAGGWRASTSSSFLTTAPTRFDAVSSHSPTRTTCT